jgi:chemotaxis signal transduction protein
MNEFVEPPQATERLMTFDIADTTYALPIADVLEVLEQAGMNCVPRLPRDQGGVLNWHGEALPVVAPHLLLGGEPIGKRSPEEVQQFLVVSDRADSSVQLGLPIDCVTALAFGEPPMVRGNEVVVERRPMDGRVVNVINPQRLVARAAEIIESAVA